jgi:hypothetical protein
MLENISGTEKFFENLLRLIGKFIFTNQRCIFKYTIF